jgi:hypothetical protein
MPANPLRDSEMNSQMRIVSWTLAANALIVALLIALLKLMHSSAWVSEHSLLANCLRMLFDMASLLGIFFVPGTALAIVLTRSRTLTFFELLARGFALNIVLLVGATSAAKLCGWVVDAPLIISIMAYPLCITALASIHRRVPTSIRNDYPLSLSVVFFLFLIFFGLFAFLSGYTTIGPEQHWLIEQVGGVSHQSPHALKPAVSVRYGSGVTVLEDHLLALTEGTGKVIYSIPASGPTELVIRYLVDAPSAGVFRITRDGRQLDFTAPQPFNDRGRMVRFQNQAVAKAALTLRPGSNAITLGFEDSVGKPARCVLLDCTNLDGDRFLEIFSRRYRFVTYVLMYDIMEAFDFTSNLTRMPYLYHSAGTPENPGYAVTNPPLSYMFASFGYVLMGGSAAALNRVAFAEIAATFFVALYLVHLGLPHRNRFACSVLSLGTLSLLTILTAGVSLHFMTHFMFLCCLIAWVFLFKGNRGLFIAFSLFGCLSAWAGYYFCVLGLLCYAILWREIKWPLRLLASVTAAMGTFLILLLAAGYALGVLHDWMSVILWENLRRFGTEHLYQAGSRLIFFKCVLLASAFTPFACVLKRDREANFFLLFSVLYTAMLLLAPSNEWKIHYLPTLVFPLMIAGGRAIALSATAEGKRVFNAIVYGVILVGTGCGLIYLLAFARGGGLIS